MKDYRRRERQISLVAGLVLIVATFVGGGAVFLVMQHNAESLLGRTLLLSLQNRIEQIRSGIAQHISAARTIATRPFIIQQATVLATNPHDASARAALLRAAKTFLPTGFTSVVFYDRDERELARAGREVSNAKLSVKLAGPEDSQLLWKQGLVLRVRTPMMRGPKRVGTVVTESSLRRLGNALFRIHDLAQTGDVAVCAPGIDGAAYMQCFPSTLTSHVFLRQPRVVGKRPLPMSRALNGHSGVLITHDYRHREVVAAYGPVPELGLGLVLKVDTAELYTPVWKQVPYVLTLLSLTVISGVVLLRWWLMPLVKEVVHSERTTRDTLEKLREGESRIRAVLDNIDEGIITFSRSGVIESINPAAERMFDYRSEEVAGGHIDTLMPDHLHTIGREVPEQQADGVSSLLQGHGREATAMRRDGTEFPVGVRISQVRIGNQWLYVEALHDLTVQKQNSYRMLHLATHDQLTGLPNRLLLQDRIQQAMARAQRNKTLVAVMFIDLDNFKTINDSLGHDVGDRFLQAVAERIASCLRREDTVARQGGDEFVVVLGDVASPGDAGEVAAKVRAALKNPYGIGKHQLQSSASIGIALFPRDGQQVDDLLKKSDAAMYRAKSAGRNSFRFFSAAEDSAGKDRA